MDKHIVVHLYYEILLSVKNKLPRQKKICGNPKYILLSERNNPKRLHTN